MNAPGTEPKDRRQNPRMNLSRPGKVRFEYTKPEPIFIVSDGTTVSIEETKRAGLPAFRQTVAQVMPLFADRVDDLKDWDQIKLLTVAVNRPNPPPFR